MDTVSSTRLVLCHPVVITRYNALDQKSAAAGIRLRITQGVRTWQEQDALYAQGRTVLGKRVTDAHGGYSGHNFGYAVDVAPDDPNFPEWRPDWSERDTRWAEVLAMALECGFAEGAQWRTLTDCPHLYLKECPSTPTEAMREKYRISGMPGVWQLIDKLIGLQAPGIETDITA